MSQENLERTRLAFDAFNGGDIDAYLALIVEVVDLRDLGDSGIATLRVRGRGLDSGVPFEETIRAAGEWRDGKVRSWRNFGSEAEALKAAGLQE